VSTIATRLNILLREDKINAMGHLILVSIICVIAFTYLPVTAKVNATPNTPYTRPAYLSLVKTFLSRIIKEWLT
jgi:hypothetical protein